MSGASFYNSKAKHGRLEVFEARRLKGLESESAKTRCSTKWGKGPAGKDTVTPPGA
jgi:hypothetical protein